MMALTHVVAQRDAALAEADELREQLRKAEEDRDHWKLLGGGEAGRLDVMWQRLVSESEAFAELDPMSRLVCEGRLRAALAKWTKP